MSILKLKFTEHKKANPTFGDVKDEQFFINSDGHFCQKIGTNDYNIIACPNGDPYTSCETIEPEDEIKQILPYVDKIEFSIE